LPWVTFLRTETLVETPSRTNNQDAASSFSGRELLLLKANRMPVPENSIRFV
jgi:hypothetical protein